MTVSLDVGALAGLLLVVGIASGFFGFWLHRRNEEARLRAHEASSREQMNAAGRARDRAREEGQETELRLQRVRQDHEGCAARIAALESLLAGLRPELETARGRVAELEAEEESVAERLDSLGQQAQVLAAVKADLAAAREAHAGCAEREQRLRERIAALTKLVEPPAPVRLDGAPGWLLATPDGAKDDLQSMRGLGPTLEAELNKLGIFHFHQMARITPRDVDWIAKKIAAFAGLDRRWRFADQARGLIADSGGRPGQGAGKRETVGRRKKGA